VATTTFLDIETTGLPDDPTTSISLLGLLDDQGFSQFRFPTRFTEFKFDTLVTYNGSAFDLPLLEKAGVAIRFEKHVDLFPIACERLNNGAFVKQTEAARRVGLRLPEGCVSGADCASFAKGGFAHPLSYAAVCLHNAVDLYASRGLFLKFVERGWVGGVSPVLHVRGVNSEERGFV